MDFLSAFSLHGNLQFGVDIGASTVKIVAVKANKNDIKIVGIGIEETPPGCITDGILTDSRAMGQVLKSCIAQTGVRNPKGVKANIGLRGVPVVFRRVILPKTSPEEMEDQILLEAQQQIESDLSEWIIDKQILSNQDKQGQVPVMLVGAKRYVVEEYMNLLKSVSLKPSIFDCDIFAIANAYEFECSGNLQETVLCLEIGRDTSKFNLLQNGIPVIVRSFQNGGIHLTDLIAKKMAIEFEQAESLKKSISETNSSQATVETDKAFAEHIKEIVSETKQTLEYFANSNADSRIDSIDKIILSGGGAVTRGLSQSLSQALNSPVEFANPFKQLNCAGRIEEVFSETPPHIFNVALGLSLRKVGDSEV